GRGNPANSRAGVLCEDGAHADFKRPVARPPVVMTEESAHQQVGAAQRGGWGRFHGTPFVQVLLTRPAHRIQSAKSPSYQRKAPVPSPPERARCGTSF